MSGLTFNDDERDAIFALSSNLETLAEMFEDREESPQALRMVIASIREAAVVFEGACERWESA